MVTASLLRQIEFEIDGVKLEQVRSLIGALIIPIATYGCEIWTLRAADERFLLK